MSNFFYAVSSCLVTTYRPLWKKMKQLFIFSTIFYKIFCPVYISRQYVYLIEPNIILFLDMQLIIEPNVIFPNAGGDEHDPPWVHCSAPPTQSCLEPWSRGCSSEERGAGQVMN